MNPFHVKCTKELDDNSPTKNERKDPKTIAMLVKDGRFREVYIPDRQKQETEMLMQELLLMVPNASKLLDIKGIGMVTAAVIVSEIGDIHRFHDP